VALARYGNQLKLASYYPPDLVAKVIPQAAYLREALEDLLRKNAAAVRKTKG
jgi:hypothetical protein